MIEEFAVDFRNAFNLVSTKKKNSFKMFFPQNYSLGFPGAMVPILSCGHLVGHLSSKVGVQQGDLLGPLFFALVLNASTSCFVLGI